MSQNASLANKIRLTPETNLHLTLKFLGETKTSQISPLKECLNQLSSQARIKVSEIKGMGAFPNPKKPRAIFANITTGQNQLESLCSDLDKLLEPHGFSPTPKRTPHITLARLGRNIAPQNLGVWLESQKEISFGSLSSADLALYESTLHPDGSVYNIIHRSSLAVENSA